MAEDKIKPKTDTSGVTRIFDVKGKIADNIEINVTSGHHNIAINFSDKTAIILSIDPCVAVFPYLEDWTTGDCKVIKEWEPITSISIRQ